MLQMTFTEFPGHEPQTTQDGVTWLPSTPYKQLADADDGDAIGDATLELADWMLEAAPAAFGFAGDDHSNYEAYNDLSIAIATDLNDAVDGRKRVAHPRHRENPKCWPEWTQDCALAPGVVVQLAWFRKA